MRRRVGSAPIRACLTFLLLLPALPTVVRAQVIDEEEVHRFTIGGYVGYGGTSMGEFNQNIDVVNYFLTNQGIPLREADKFSGSATFKGELRYKLSQRFMVGFGVGNSEAQSRFDVTLGGVDFYARSTLWMPSVYYVLPFVQSSETFAAVADRLNLYVGAGPVFFQKGHAHMRITDRSTESTFNVDGDMGEIDGEGDAMGTGIGAQGLFGASYQLTRAISVAGEVGYRYGKINDLKLTHAEGYDRDDTDGDPNQREPGVGAVYDFFDRDRTRPPGLPEQDIEGNHIPYYSDYDGKLDLDFSGITLQIGMRLHLF